MHASALIENDYIKYSNIRIYVHAHSHTQCEYKFVNFQTNSACSLRLMIYCNSVKIGIAIKSTMRAKLIVSFYIRCICICICQIARSFSPATPFIPRALFHLFEKRSAEFYCVGYKIKANTNTSSNIKRQRYKTNVKIAGIASFSLLHMDTPSFGWFVGFDWQFGFRQTRTQTPQLLWKISKHAK